MHTKPRTVLRRGAGRQEHARTHGVRQRPPGTSEEGSFAGTRRSSRAREATHHDPRREYRRERARRCTHGGPS